ncbi:site-specific integrase [Methylocystis sp.]|uniref:tyrosine-type recombinase/integrase n=1 Tax=Methylocystis sp. TaxID=1911079 RepID=UPI0025DD882B|nr:site-specific integrase [Methylocystis sp.]
MLKFYRRTRDKNYRIRGTLFGVCYEESAGTADQAAAQILCNKRVEEVTRAHLEGRVLGRRISRSFAEAVVTYLEAGGERRFLAPLLDHFGATPIERIDQQALDEAARVLLPGRAPATINRQIFGPMSAVLKAAGMKRKFERRNEPKGRVRALTPEEAQRLIDACSPHLRPLVVFLLLTGARVGEALWLDWRDVDLERAHVNFAKTKNGKPRGVILNADVVAALADLPHRQGEVFRRPDGLPYERRDPSDDGDTSAGARIKKAFAGAVKRAGLADLHPHDLRHSWASWHFEANRDLIGLMGDGGWHSLRMVERYAHRNQEHRRGAYDALPRLKIG